MDDLRGCTDGSGLIKRLSDPAPDIPKTPTRSMPPSDLDEVSRSAKRLRISNSLRSARDREVSTDDEESGDIVPPQKTARKILQSDSEDNTETDPPPAKGVKRNDPASTPPPSPQKKRVAIKSTIAKGLAQIESGDSPDGIFRYMGKCSHEEYEEQVRQAGIRSQAEWERDQARREAQEEHKQIEVREAARLRQQKHREKKRKAAEMLVSAIHFLDQKNAHIRIAEQEPTPEMQLTAELLKNDKMTVARMTRPAIEIRKHDTEKRGKKPQGRPKTREPVEPKNANWHTAPVWRSIEKAVVQAGSAMKTGDIILNLQKQDPRTFAHIARSTVDGWIVRKGPDGRPCKPHWSASAIRMKAKNNLQGGQGGRIGVFVSAPLKP